MHDAPLTLYHKAHFQYFYFNRYPQGRNRKKIPTFIISKFGCGTKNVNNRAIFVCI